MTRTLNILTLALLTAFGGATAFAQTTAAPAGTTAAVTASGPTQKLTTQFADWAGSPDNARALVDGLRTGKAITLTAPPATGQTASTMPTSTTFTPPTKPMGYGNVRIALALAQTQLAKAGITQPTPQQLQTALNGGSLTVGSGADARATQLQGVLQMRASGMGWGKIAQNMGVKLGTVMSGKTPPSGGVATANSTAVGGKAEGKGVTTAAGTGTSGGRASQRSGVVSAAGGTPGAGMGQAHAQTKGTVTSANGMAAGQSQAGGHGKNGK